MFGKLRVKPILKGISHKAVRPNPAIPLMQSYKMAIKHLQTFAPSENLFTFQVLPDNKNCTILPCIYHGTLEEHFKEFVELNNQGAAIHVCVQKTDLQGRCKENITAIRAFFVESDGEGKSLPIKPHLIVTTSPGRFHAYYVVNDFTVEDFNIIQRCMIKHFGSDKNAKDTTRTLRLAGFLHQKKMPHLVRISKINSLPPYSKNSIFKTLKPYLDTHSHEETSQTSHFHNQIKVNPQKVLKDGERTGALTSFAGALFHQGFSELQVLHAVRAWNITACKPPLPDKKVTDTVSSIYKTHKRNAETNSDHITVWNDPIFFDQLNTPDIPALLLPTPLAKFAQAVANTTETPEALAVMTIIGIASTCLLKKVEVSFQEDWEETINIYTMILLGSGNNKTAVIKLCSEPITAWERSQHIEIKPEIIRANSLRQTEIMCIEALRKQAAKPSTSEERRQVLRTEIATREALLPEVPILPKLFINDVTPESLIESVSQQGGKIGIISDENGVLESMAGLYNNGHANVDIFLKGIDGGEVRVKRKDKDISINPYLSVVLAVQPVTLQRMAEKRAFEGNGVIERFLYAIPKSKLGYRKLINPPIPREVKNNYLRIVNKLLSISPRCSMANDGSTYPHVLYLSARAKKEFHKFRTEIEQKVRPQGELECCPGWAAKICGFTLRIAGIFHVVMHGIENTHIQFASMHNAIRLARLLCKHAVAAYGRMGTNQSDRDAQDIANWLIKYGKLEVTRTEITERFRNHQLAQKERLNKALEILQDRHYIHSWVDKSTRKPTTRYQINPSVITKEENVKFVKLAKS